MTWTRPALWIDFFIELLFDVGLNGEMLGRGDVDPDAPSLGRIDGWEDVSIDPSMGVPEYPEPGVWPSTTPAN